jgi:general secretion pathway protein C
MLARLSAFVIWALVAGTTVFWGLRLFVHAPVAPSYAVAVGDAATSGGDLNRLLGAPPVVAGAAARTSEGGSRFRLLGIVAPKYASASQPSGYGVALIAVDGKMPRAYPVGAKLDGDLVLQSVSLRTVLIAPSKGAPTITLELPAPTPAATGTLSVGGSSSSVASPPVAQPVPQYNASPPLTPIQAAQQQAQQAQQQAQPVQQAPPNQGPRAVPGAPSTQ